MTLMTQTLMWLASPIPFDLAAANTVELAHTQISLNSDDLKSVLDRSLFDHPFFEILDSCYLDYLKRAMMSFGQVDTVDLEGMSTFIVPDDDADDKDEDMDGQAKKAKEPDSMLLWANAFPKYITELCRKLMIWVERKLPTIGEMSTRLVLDSIIPKIKFLDNNNMLVDHKMMPTVLCKIPLLSVLFYTDLAASVSEVSDGIAILSLGRYNHSLHFDESDLFFL